MPQATLKEGLQPSFIRTRPAKIIRAGNRRENSSGILEWLASFPNPPLTNSKKRRIGYTVWIGSDSRRLAQTCSLGNCRARMSASRSTAKRSLA